MTDLLTRTTDYVSSPAGRGRREPSPRTVKARQKRLSYWTDWRLAEGDPTREELEGYREWLGQGDLAPSTQHAYLQTVFAFCRWGHRHSYLDHDPSLDLTLPDPQVEPEEILSRAEFQSMMLHGEELDGLILSLLMGTALRAQEACGLRFRDIAADGRVSVLGKGRKRRSVYVDKFTGFRIRDWKIARRAQDDDLVLGMGASGLRKRVHRLAKAAGIERRIHPHLIRHTSLHLHAEGATNIDAVREMAGHADLRTTQTYLHANASSVQRAHREAAVMEGMMLQ
jgi:integrase